GRRARTRIRRSRLTCIRRCSGDHVRGDAVSTRHRTKGRCWQRSAPQRTRRAFPVKYSVITFGCRVNQADSLGFEEELLATGAEAVSPDRAGLVVVNTCSVTATADQGARQTIRRVARDNPGARIVVTGCYATRRPDEVRALANVACVVPNDDKPRLLSILRNNAAAERAALA